MIRRNRPCPYSPIVLLVWALLILAPARHALAQPPDCPADTAPEEFQGTLSNSSRTISLDVKPCQTVLFEISITPSSPVHGVSVTWQVFNKLAGQLYEENWAVYDPETKSSPFSYHWIPPYRGTRGDVGLPGSATLHLNTLAWQSGDYRIRVIKKRRPDYNIGGPSMPESVPIDPTQTYRGSLYHGETGQFFMITLQPGESFYMTGSVLAHSFWGTQFVIEIYDTSYSWLATLKNFAPGGYETFKTSTFTNSNVSTSDFIIRVVAFYHPVHDFQLDFWIGNDHPQLKLFLDVNDPDDPDSFDPEAPEDESSMYIPGSRLNKTSEDVPLVDGIIQDYLRVIAAYVASNGGRVVTPPPGGSLTLSLENTSQFVGTAMNYGTSDQPDFSLADAGPFAFTEMKYVITGLNCLDYGGLTRVRATRGGDSATLQLPYDSHDNWIADIGWAAGTAPIADTNLGNGSDEDDTPAVTTPPAQGIVGDGFTNFEEYRGFVVRGEHRRTNPFTKDLFISSDLTSGIAFAHPNLPLATHRVTGVDEPGQTNYRPADRVMNWNYQNAGPQGDIPNHNDQKALRVKEMATDPLQQGYYGYTFPTVGTPNEVIIIEIYMDVHAALAGPPYSFTAGQRQNELSRTVGHEVGHGIHICHRPGPCPDGALPGSADSIMSLSVTGTPVGDPLSQYNSADRPQIRLHVRF